VNPVLYYVTLDFGFLSRSLLKKSHTFAILSFQPKYNIHIKESRELQGSLAWLHSKTKSNPHTMIHAAVPGVISDHLLFSFPAAFAESINISVHSFLIAKKTWQYRAEVSF